MARVFPEHLPQWVLDDPGRQAERRVYDALRALPDPFIIFYGVHWLSRTKAGMRDGEADFVIAHPEKGVLVLEVKGGGIEFDAAVGQWFSVDRAGRRHRIKDPVIQARASKHALLEKLKEMPDWRKDWITMGHGIVFPDVVVKTVRLRPDLSRAIVVDRSDLSNPVEAISRIFDFWQKGDDRASGPGLDGMKVITKLLARSFKLRTLLGVELQHEDARIIELTEGQMRVLDMLSEYRRAAIQGCAGSGKTMLAMEKARRLAEEGFDVLLTCFNVPLAQYLAQRVPKGVTVYNFHRLCEVLAEKAGLGLQPPSEDADDALKRTYFDVSLPEGLLEAVDVLGPQFDAIIVDEGQDFDDDWWLGLESLLRDPEHGVFYVFFDDNQNLYRDENRIPGIIDIPPIRLYENCRNTRSIHELVVRFHPDGERIRNRGPVGRKPLWIPYDSNEDMLKLVRRALHRLINEEGVAPSDIVILTPKAERRSKFVGDMRLGNFTLSRTPPSEWPEGANWIWVTSIYKFKGLERRVVFIVELEPWLRNLQTLLYVGCSRARTHLLLFHNHHLNPPTL